MAFILPIILNTGSGASGGPDGGGDWSKTPGQWVLFVMICIMAIAVVAGLVYIFVNFDEVTADNTKHPSHSPTPTVSSSTR